MKKIVISEFDDYKFASRSRKIALSLAENGYIVTCIMLTGKESKPCSMKIAENLDLILIQKKYEYKGLTTKIINVFYFNIQLFKILRKKQFDILHFYDIKTMFANYIFHLLNKHNNIIYDCNELHSEKRSPSFKNSLLNKIDYLIELLFIHKMDLIIHASRNRSDFFKKKYGITNVITIENHVKYQNIPNNNDYLIKFSKISKKNKVIVYTGNISYGANQRIDNVIKSLTNLDCDIHFCLLGRIIDEADKILIRIAEEYGVANRVHFVKPVLFNEVVDVISGADIAVIPISAVSLNSRYSALNKLSQALMAGLPIAATGYENIISVINSEKYGMAGKVFSVEDPIDISRAILGCLKKQKIMKKNALSIAKEELNWGNEEMKLLNAYKLFQ